MTRYTVTTRRRGWPILRGLAVIFFLLSMFSYVIGVEAASWLGALALFYAFILAGIRWVTRK